MLFCNFILQNTHSNLISSNPLIRLRASSACGEGLAVKLRTDHLAPANIFMQKKKQERVSELIKMSGLDLVLRVSSFKSNQNLFLCAKLLNKCSWIRTSVYLWPLTNTHTHTHTLSNCCCHINTLTGSETAAVLCPEALEIRPYGLLWVGHMRGFRQGSGELELRGSQGKYYKPIHSDSEKIHSLWMMGFFVFFF